MVEFAYKPHFSGQSNLEKNMQKTKKVGILMGGTERPFGLRDKIGYLFGDFGNDFTFIFASSYLMVFYTKVLGLSGTAVGTLFLAARLVDAVTDVTMGRIVDSVRPAKDGRFRPWIRRMCIPVAVASTLMYLYGVAEWPYPLKMLYVVVTYLLWSSFCYTAINIPYGSMASVISDRPGDRASLSTYRSIGASLASLVIGTVVPLIIYDTDISGNQVVNAGRFTVTAVVFGVCAVICYVLCYTLCAERVTITKGAEGKVLSDTDGSNSARNENTNETEQSPGQSPLASSILGNRPLAELVCASLLLLLASMLGQTMNNYLFLDYFRNARALVWVNLLTVGAMLALAPFISKFSVKVGKKEIAAAGMLIAAVFYLLLAWLRVSSIPLFMVFLFLGTLGMGMFNIIIWAFITDIIDNQEVLTGKREDGTVYAVYSFARKVGQALAGGLGGFALTAIGYVSDAAGQSREVAGRIYTVATLVPGICYLLVFLVLQFWYPLSRAKVEENIIKLRERRR